MCTPMDISKVDDFDPTTVPTIGLLFEEMEKLGPDVKRKTEWEHTSMKGPVEIFRKFVEGISVENQARRKELGGAQPTQRPVATRPAYCPPVSRAGFAQLADTLGCRGCRDGRGR